MDSPTATPVHRRVVRPRATCFVQAALCSLCVVYAVRWRALLSSRVLCAPGPRNAPQSTLTPPPQRPIASVRERCPTSSWEGEAPNPLPALVPMDTVTPDIMPGEALGGGQGVSHCV